MRAYILRRLILAIPSLIVVTLVLFFIIRLIPGNLIQLMVSQNYFSSAKDLNITTGLIKHELGLDQPIYVQYWKWVWNIVAHGDLGRSLWSNIPVAQQLGQRLPVSIELGIMAMIIALLIAIPIGIYSGIRQDTVGDYIARSFGILCICLPSFWIGTMVIVFPSIWWGWVPSLEMIPFMKDPLGNLGMFIIPAVILGMATSGTTMRMTRTMMLEVLRQDYIRTAWSKGLRERIVVMRHALKNALIPVVTLIGINIPILVGGSVIIEQIFALPGMGRLLLDSISNRDYTVVSGINLVVASFVLVTNLLVDMTYGFLDPRVHYR